MEPIDIIELLERDHREIDRLVSELDDADDVATIRRIFLHIVDELSAHEAVEHEVLYPAFEAAVAGAGDVLAHRISEHEELNELLDEMRGLAPDGFAFLKRGSALLLEMQGHFLAEEQTVFDRMRRELSPEALVELGRRATLARAHAPAWPVGRHALTAH
jgi:hemerythrin superfamily protein